MEEKLDKYPGWENYIICPVYYDCIDENQNLGDQTGHPGKSWDGKVREMEGGISAIPLENYHVLKIKNNIKNGDSFTKILHAKGLWQSGFLTNSA